MLIGTLQYRETIRLESKKWAEEQHKTKEEVEALIDLAVLKDRENYYIKDNKILWIKTDFSKKHQFNGETKEFVETIWVCFEKPVYCCLLPCRVRSRKMLIDVSFIGHLTDTALIYSRFCPIHAKSIHRMYSSGLVWRQTPEQKIKNMLWMAKEKKRLKDLFGLDF